MVAKRYPLKYPSIALRSVSDIPNVNAQLNVLADAFRKLRNFSGDALNDHADFIDASTTASIPAGGTANQALTKIDGADYNTAWVTIDNTFVGSEPAFSKNTGFNLNLGTITGTVSEGDHLHTGVYEPAFGAGTIATQNANAVSISGGVITGITDLAIADGGTGASTAGGARTNLDVDQAGTDNSTDVTLAGSLDYLTIVGQAITRNAIVLTTDISGILPLANGGTNDAAVTAANIGHLKAMDQDVGTTDDHTMGKLIATDTTDSTGPTSSASGKLAGGLSVAKKYHGGDELKVRKDQTAPTRISVANGGTLNAATSARFSLFDGSTEAGWIERRRDGTGENVFGVFDDSVDWVFYKADATTKKLRLQHDGDFELFSGAFIVTAGDLTITNGEVFLNLPTVSTGTSGSLWNDSGTVKVVP